VTQAASLRLRRSTVLDGLLKDPSAYPERFTVLPLDPEIIYKVFTPERIRLLRVLREEGPFDSVQALANRVGRDESRVSRDLSYMEPSRLVKLKRHGKAKKVSASDKPIWILLE
jgi:predicted transcriptional regulator